MGIHPHPHTYTHRHTHAQNHKLRVSCLHDFIPRRVFSLHTSISDCCKICVHRERLSSEISVSRLFANSPSLGVKPLRVRLIPLYIFKLSHHSYIHTNNRIQIKHIILTYTHQYQHTYTIHSNVTRIHHLNTITDLFPRENPNPRPATAAG
jgi:hypothetical protein